MDKGLEILKSDNNRSSVKLLKDKCNFLYQTGQPFVLVKTGGSYKLDSGMFKQNAVTGGFTPDDLIFIRRVKKYIIDNDIPDKFVDVDYLDSKIDYIDVGVYESGVVLEDLLEIDINGAYWETAYILGVISKAIYERGKEVDKKVRLASLGSLAKKKDVWIYDGKKMKRDVIRSYQTENIWFAICKRVSDVMQEAVKLIGSEFVFYWVDGIYIRNDKSLLGSLISLFASYGYETKVKSIHSVKFKETSFDVYGVKEGDHREFFYPVKGKRNTIKDYNEDRRLKQLASKILLGK
jgi:hypothetical protein